MSRDQGPESLIHECIDAELEELMPRFFANVRRDLAVMREAHAAQDWETLARHGHSLKGSGHGFGLTSLGELGASIEAHALDAATGAPGSGLTSLLEGVDEYLQRVRLIYE